MFKLFLLLTTTVSLAGCATLEQGASAQAAPSEGKRLECAAYYELLSVAGDQPDISKNQLSKAFYALLHQVGDTPDSEAVIAMKMKFLQDEIPGKMTTANVAALRLRHDRECKALLRSAWCETYKGLSPNACVK